jgi:hypothetical protein
LRQLARHADLRVKLESIKSLFALDRAGLPSDLLAQVINDPDPKAAEMAIDLIGNYGIKEAADPLLRITDPSQLLLDIQLPAQRADAWAKDRDITVIGRRVIARATQAGAVVGEGQTVSLRARVTAGVAQLRPGEFVQVQVPFVERTDAWPLPLVAVVRQGEQAYVFARTATGFEARPVTVLDSAGEAVSVQGPLKAGDAVAVSSVIALKAAWLGESGGE